MIKRKDLVLIPPVAQDQAIIPAAGPFRTAIWLGLVVGMLEVILLMAHQSMNHVALIGSLRLNQHYLWMVPLSQLVVFGTVGFCLELLARTGTKLARVVVPWALAGLASLAMLLAFRELNPIASVILALGIASRVVPLGRRLGLHSSKLIRASLPYLIATLVILIVGRYTQFAWAQHEASTRPAPTVGSPNVLFIVLDTVRAKSLSLYGYDRPTSPRLEALAQRGVRFDQARATAPWTLPSHASMFTGRWPHELFDSPEQTMRSGVPTLAEFLGNRGYSTAGFVANTYYCNAGFGLARGFDYYEDFYQVFDTSPTEILRHSGLGRNLIALVGDEALIRPGGRKNADKVNSDFLNWLPTNRDRPFFAFLNYFDAHAPYILPDGVNRRLGNRLIAPEDIELVRNWHSRSTASATDHELEVARNAYDDCIAYLDSALGRLFDELQRRGVLDNTLIIVTSDHGEEIGEHGLTGHGRSLYSEELHVPLIVVPPKQQIDRLGGIISDPVSLRDLPTSIVDLAGFDRDLSPFPGRSLSRFRELHGSGSAKFGSKQSNDEPVDSDVVLTEVTLRDKISRNLNRPPALRGPMKSVVALGHVYIRNSDSEEELYDLINDRLEIHNLADSPSYRELLEQLRNLSDLVHPEDGP